MKERTLKKVKSTVALRRSSPLSSSRNNVAATLYHRKDFEVMKSKASHPRRFTSISSMSSHKGAKEETIQEFRRKVNGILQSGRNNSPPTVQEAKVLVKGLYAKYGTPEEDESLGPLLSNRQKSIFDMSPKLTKKKSTNNISTLPTKRSSSISTFSRMKVVPSSDVSINRTVYPITRNQSKLSIKMLPVAQTSLSELNSSRLPS